ncbi:nitroreductase family protein [Actinophytocola algeriensis]|uniref:Nitroreductase n=1 Tax=Actinophytocola algeriensis TaxID=1768010 RepID=A0A7W7VHW2_9PSEU|nr:nitroreductase family protein [Actinophytocola algeriensis]MBB4910649.1 nitroreductase [Actinophytocola algeriensis]MBE1473642.1 nitroreductase [Actinophytocola algeriensis]
MSRTTSVTATEPIRWVEARQPPTYRPVRPEPLPAGLATVVARLEYAVGHRAGSTKRAAPSAGGCYPYELFVSPASATEPVVGHVDLHQRWVTVPSGDQAGWAGDRFRYYLVGRPWFSVRKYGRRGFLYHLVDAGHAMLNLSLTSGTPDPDRPADAIAGRLARRGGALLGFGVLDADDSGRTADGWVLRQATGPEPQNPLNDIEEITRGLLPDPPEPLRLALPPSPARTRLADAIPTRHSAAAFHGAVAAGELAEFVARFVELCDRIVPELGVPIPGFQVFSRHPGVGRPLPEKSWLTGALLGQSHLTGASAFVVVHARVEDAPTEALSVGTQRLITASGLVGEIIYLAASQAGLGVTGIGGFDPRLWATACATTEDIIYVLAIGREADGEKFDVTNPNGSHG